MSSTLVELLVGTGPPLPHLSRAYKPNSSSNSSHVNNISGHDRVLNSSSSSSDHVHHYKLTQAMLHSHAVSTTLAAMIMRLTSTAATSATCQQPQHQQPQLPSLPRPCTNCVPHSHCCAAAFDPHTRPRRYATTLRQAHRTTAGSNTKPCVPKDANACKRARNGGHRLPAFDQARQGSFICTY